ncbi:MAG TPA: aspartyl-phosphate phosphatase Spo0E family protein [Bacillota bacterium]|nr:aspartyl-phosphate phosphatase Spo0E family protein [Bacillota bacterium]
MGIEGPGLPILDMIETERERLHHLVKGQRDKLGAQEVYNKSCELDRLLIHYLRLNTGDGQWAED